MLIATSAFGASDAFSRENAARSVLSSPTFPIRISFRSVADSTGGTDGHIVLEVNAAPRGKGTAAHLSTKVEDYMSASLLASFAKPAGGFDLVALVQLEGGPAVCYGRGPIYLFGIGNGKLTQVYVDICNPNRPVVSRSGKDIRISAPKWYNERTRGYVAGDEILIHEGTVRDKSG